MLMVAGAFGDAASQFHTRNGNYLNLSVLTIFSKTQKAS